MNAETPPLKSTAKRQADESPEFIDLSVSELDGLIERLEQARDHHLALSSKDYELLLSALLTLASMQERLSHNDLTIAKLKKLLGIVKSSEKFSDLVSDQENQSQGGSQTQGKGSGGKGNSRGNSNGNGNGNSNSNKDKKKRGNGKQKTSSSSQSKPTNHHHQLTAVARGMICPICHKGTLYKYTPAVMLRVIGHAPLSSERHLCEQLRCSGCGEIFTAELPESIKADGGANQKYGYTARTVMSIYKYFAGTPFNRQETLQQLLGTAVAASTVFDQCEHVANALNPIFKAIKVQAAQAWLFYLDDTSNRILRQEPVQKTRGGKTRWRSGVYTSSCLAITAQGHRLVLFQTNVGHAGEWMEEILNHRDAGLDPPIVMSDALSANHVMEHLSHKALCNVHARRGFAQLVDDHIDEAIFALEHYKKPWTHESHCEEHALSPSERLAYHKKHSLPVMETLLEWCETELASERVEPNSNLGRAMNYFIRHYEGLTAFCRIEGAPLDNNEIERLIKVVVRSRKNSLFFKTLIGAEVSDIITSVLTTCYEHGVNAFDYLNAVQRHQDAVRAEPEKWMPWNYPQL